MLTNPRRRRSGVLNLMLLKKEPTRPGVSLPPILHTLYTTVIPNFAGLFIRLGRVPILVCTSSEQCLCVVAAARVQFCRTACLYSCCSCSCGDSSKAKLCLHTDSYKYCREQKTSTTECVEINIFVEHLPSPSLTRVALVWVVLLTSISSVVSLPVGGTS